MGTETETTSAVDAQRRLHLVVVRLGGWLRADALLRAQEGSPDDLVRLVELGHIAARLTGTNSILPLAEHFEHGGSPRVVQVCVTRGGLRSAVTPTNRVLTALQYQRRMRALASWVCTAADVDVSWLASIAGHGHVRLASLAGETLDFSYAHQLAPTLFTVEVTTRARRGLPFVPLI